MKISPPADHKYQLLNDHLVSQSTLVNRSRVKIPHKFPIINTLADADLEGPGLRLGDSRVSVDVVQETMPEVESYGILVVWNEIHVHDDRLFGHPGHTARDPMKP
jgi:hypothetical protein